MKQETCENCIEKRKQECIGSKNNQICELFKPAPNISQDTKDNWPKLGDASYIRYKKSGHSAYLHSYKSSHKQISHSHVTQTTNLQNGTISPPTVPKPTHNPIKRVFFFCSTYSFDKITPIEFTVLVSRKDGLAVRIKRSFTKIIDVVCMEPNKLELIFRKLELISLPTQRNFGTNSTNADFWKLDIDGTKYLGYLTQPDFVEKIKKIINYDCLYRKYFIAMRELDQTFCSWYNQ